MNIPLFTLACSLSCTVSSLVLADDHRQLGSSDNPVYMAFSGGGYHAHAGASAVMMAAMDRLRQQELGAVGLADITPNVAAFSSNSGGSWFLTQATFSQKFQTALEADKAWQTYTSPEGYFGQAWSYINASQQKENVCSKFIIAKKECEQFVDLGGPFFKFLASGSGRWDELTHNAVFGAKFSNPDLNMAEELADTQFGDENDRLAWAKSIPLVVASATISDAPALAYQDSKGITKPILSLIASQDQSAVPGAAPALFFSAGSSNKTKPNFYPGSDLSLQYGYWNRLKAKFEPQESPVTLGNAEVDYNCLNPIHVAANSSAAGGGFINIPLLRRTIPSADVAVGLNGFAPPYALRDPASDCQQSGKQFSFIGPIKQSGIPRSLDDFIANRVVRMADGGFVDNTTVAYMLRYMADNGELTEGFNIMAMENLPAQPLKSPNKVLFPTGGDVGRLFGYPDPDAKVNTSEFFGFSFTGVTSTVFEPEPFFDPVTKEPTKGADWEQWIDPEPEKPKKGIQYCNLYLSYTQYQVTTKANAYFGLGAEHAGVSGTLHVFAVLGAKAGVVPMNEFQALTCYPKLVAGVHKAVLDDTLFGTQLQRLMGF